MKTTIKSTQVYKGETIYELSDGSFETRLNVGGPLGVLVNGHRNIEEAKDYLDKNDNLKLLEKR